MDHLPILSHVGNAADHVPSLVHMISVLPIRSYPLLHWKVTLSPTGYEFNPDGRMLPNGSGSGVGHSIPIRTIF